MRILFVGALWEGSTGLQRMVALRDLGHNIVEQNAMSRRKPSVVERILSGLGYQLDTVGINNRILISLQQSPVDIIWVDKTLSISRSTLLSIKRTLPCCKLVFYSPDDMMIPSNQTRQYRACLPIYDLHVTTKSYNEVELKALGAKEVLVIDNAYDPYTHHPVPLTAEERIRWQAEVGFIGAFEQDRYEMMLHLAQVGMRVTVRGPGWEPYVGQHTSLAVQPGWVYGDDYARAICATKVNLGFLRKVARDIQTTRSIEIPACGGFMLAERTGEHLRLFVEGQEAEFFSDFDELLQKVRYYSTHDAERERIAHAGRERCVQSGYSNHDRLTTVLKHLESLHPGGWS